MIAHAFTVLTLKRSILTEKVARRGYHLSREYAVDPLELLYVREVMQTAFIALPRNCPVEEVAAAPQWNQWQTQRLLPVIEASDKLVGLVTSDDIRKWLAARLPGSPSQTVGELVRNGHVQAFGDEPLRAIVYRMAELGITRMPVVARRTGKLEGLVSLDDLLKARTKHLEEERHREQTLRFRYFSDPLQSSPVDSET